MIIIGYPGIGKTTLSKNMDKVIDLESSNFLINGRKEDNWYIPYCQIADDLSRQGFIVFVSSHKQVREFLYNNSKEFIIDICPSIDLKDEWINKIKERYEFSGLEKDKRAYERAKSNYEDDINDFNSSPKFKNYSIIDNMDYNLKNMVLDFLCLSNT